MVWEIACRALDANGKSGDGYIVTERGDSWLVVVFDALGHGHDAAEVKDEALKVLKSSSQKPLRDVISDLHAGLKRSRGLVMSVVEVGKIANVLRWAGVGNVEAMLMTKHDVKYVVGAGGVVGYNLPAVRVTGHAFEKGDILALYTDGVAASVSASLRAAGANLRGLEGMLDEHWSRTDDALLWVGLL